MGGKKTEKYRKNVFKRAKTVNVAKSRKNHWYSFGDFGLKICMGHVFLLWLLLECSKAYATKSSESLTELLHFFFLNVWRPFYVHRKTVCVGWCSVYKDITSDIQQLLNV